MPTIPPSLTPTPTPAPQRNDRATFSTRVDAFVTWLITFVAEMVALATNCYDNAVDSFNSSTAAAASAAAAAASASKRFKGASSTSVTLPATGEKVLTLDDASELAFQVGMQLKATSTSNSANNFIGEVKTYVHPTLTLTVTATSGTGAHTDWAIGAHVTDSSMVLLQDTTPQLGGDLDANGHQMQWSKGSDIASAAALAVLTDGNYFDVTGTATITSINTTKVGTLIRLHFDDALTLTHHATNLVLPGGANITTAAGDEAEFIEYATGDYRCTNYSKADGTGIVPSGLTLLATVTATAAATADIEDSFSTYDNYLIIGDLTIGTDATSVVARIKTSGSYITTTTYNYHIAAQSDGGGTYAGNGSASANSVLLGATMGNLSTESMAFTLSIYKPSSTVLPKRFKVDGLYSHSDGTNRNIAGFFTNDSTAALTGVQIFPVSGTMTGTFRLYGVTK